jgi:hypothetical protein
MVLAAIQTTGSKISILLTTNCIHRENLDDISGSVELPKTLCMRSVYSRIEEDVGCDLHGTKIIRLFYVPSLG